MWDQLFTIVMGELLKSQISVHPFQKCWNLLWFKWLTDPLALFQNQRWEPSVHREHLTNGQGCYFSPIMLYRRGEICSCYVEKKEERQHSQRAPKGRVEYQMFVAWKCLQLEAQSTFRNLTIRLQQAYSKCLNKDSSYEACLERRNLLS